LGNKASIAAFRKASLRISGGTELMEDGVEVLLLALLSAVRPIKRLLGGTVGVAITKRELKAIRDGCFKALKTRVIFCVQLC
jgi:hypothetical protein